jgi:hypothetical protein
MMPKVNDIKAYTRDIFAKAGLGDDVLKQVLSAFDDDKALKAFTDNFKPLPDYSHDMDQVREKTKADKDAEYKEWYDQEQKKYQEYVNGMAELEQFRRVSGNPSGREGAQMTQAEIDKLVEAKLQASLESVLSRRDQAYLSFRDADFDHMKRFNKPMDRVAFEKTWKEHPEWGGDLFNAYEKWISPEVEKQRETEMNAKMEQKYQEGIRDGYSRKALPTDHQPKEFSPFFDRKEEVAKLTDREQEQHSRESFFKGLMEKVNT